MLQATAQFKLDVISYTPIYFPTKKEQAFVQRHLLFYCFTSCCEEPNEKINHLFRAFAQYHFNTGQYKLLSTILEFLLFPQEPFHVIYIPTDMYNSSPTQSLPISSSGSISCTISADNRHYLPC